MYWSIGFEAGDWGGDRSGGPVGVGGGLVWILANRGTAVAPYDYLVFL